MISNRRARLKKKLGLITTRRAIPKGIFNYTFFNLFSILFKMRQAKKLELVFINYTNFKQYFYILIYRLLPKKWQIVYSMKENAIFLKDYACICMVEYLNKYSKALCRKHSNFFIEFDLHIIPYKEFQVRIPWYGYASTGLYIEYFRSFKYLEYLKRFNWKPEVKKQFFVLYHSKFSWARRYVWSLAFDNFIFFDHGWQLKIFKNWDFLKHNLQNLKTFNSFFFQFLFFSTFKVYKFFCYIFTDFFSSALMGLCYKFLFLFPTQLKFYQRFRVLTVDRLYSHFRRLQFNKSKWIFVYLLKKILKEQKYSAYIFFDFSWFYPIDLVLFEIFKKCQYYRLVCQFEKDRFEPITGLFLLLWEVFLDFFYFEFTNLNAYLNNVKEFGYWVTLFKYNLEILLCEIYSSPIYTLKSKLIHLVSLRVRKLPELYFGRMFLIVYDFYLQSFDRKGPHIFFNLQFDNLYKKIFLYNSNYVKVNYNFIIPWKFKFRKLLFCYIIQCSKLHKFRLYQIVLFNDSNQFIFHI